MRLLHIEHQNLSFFASTFAPFTLCRCFQVHVDNFVINSHEFPTIFRYASNELDYKLHFAHRIIFACLRGSENQIILRTISENNTRTNTGIFYVSLFFTVCTDLITRDEMYNISLLVTYVYTSRHISNSDNSIEGKPLWNDCVHRIRI